MPQQYQKPQEEPIAVVGTGCRFPGSSATPSQLWELLRHPKHVGCTIPADRFSIDAFFNEDGKHHGATNASESYFLTEDPRAFDASFFNISASEAPCIDPQQRLLLETVYESLESAGLRIGDLKGSDTAVYAGVMCDDFSAMLTRDPETLPQYSATGTARSIISNRISYFFDWHGPSMTLDTACSSSLVAVDLAVNTLRRGESRVAVAAGTSLLLGPGMYISESKLSMLSPTGKSRMWDSSADGYARGEGVASVVLKRLSDAIADGDPIDCIIRATSVNSDGRSMGITMPSSEAQKALIRSTYAKAGLDIINRPEDRPQYFEAHGTGTPAGDPQEASAIYEAFFSSDVKSKDDGVLHVGSIKTIIGHTEGTAGLAGLIKASLSMRNETIAPNLHLQRLNPKIAPLTSRLRVPTKAVAWPELAPGVPKRASVNSFGFGGTNAHAIIESFERQALPAVSSATPQVLPFVFSATSERTLGPVLESYLSFLETYPDADLTDLAWSLFRRRADFPYRVTLNATSTDELFQAIEQELEKRKTNEASTVVSRITPGEKRILGIFTGQGAQWPQMGLDLLRASPDARGWFEELQDSLDTLPELYRPSFRLLDALSAPKESSRLHEALMSQALCTAVQVVLVKFLRALNISFTAVIGHSSGEIGAAYAAGILTASEAIRVAYLRGFVAKSAGNGAHKGAMMAVGMSFEEAQALCDSEAYSGKIKTAASNSPSSVTLSGDEDAIVKLEAELKQQNKFARLLKVDTAYHSHHMLPCSDAYLQGLAACKINPQIDQQTKWFSSVYNGDEITPANAEALKGEYWKDNMLHAVLFSQALTAAMRSSTFDSIIELGPHPALKGPASQTISELSGVKGDIPYTGLLSRGQNAITSMSTAIGHFWTHLGPNAVNVESYVKTFGASRAFTFSQNLPTYPFDRSQSYWPETRNLKAFMYNETPPNQIIGALTSDTTEGEWRWRNFLRREEIDWLEDHKIQSQSVFPATGYVAMAIEAMLIVGKNRSLNLIELHDVTIGQAIALRDDPTGVETLFKLTNLVTDGDQTSADFACHADIGGTLKRCAGGRISVTYGDEMSTTLPGRNHTEDNYYKLDTTAFYKYLAGLGYGYTGRFQGISSLSRTKDLATGHITNVRKSESQSPILLHPALMDTLLQTLLAAVGDTKDEQLYVIHIPTVIERIVINPYFYTSAGADVSNELSFDATVTEFSAEGVSGITELFDEAGNGVMQMEGIRVSPLIPPTSADDRNIFTKTEWFRVEPDATLATFESTDAETKASQFLEKSALLYISDIVNRTSADKIASADEKTKAIFSWFNEVLASASSGEHPRWKQEWLSQGRDELAKAFESVSSSVDSEALNLVGGAYASGFADRLNAIKDPKVQAILEKYADESARSLKSNEQIAQLVKQVSWRYPTLRILEINGGRGQTTRSVLQSIKEAFFSYTFTDTTDKHFEEVRSNFTEQQAERIVFKTLDIHSTELDKSFEKNSYDLVIARDIPHETLGQIRALMKPGGYLLAAEKTVSGLLHDSLVLSAINDDASTWNSSCAVADWTSMLVDAGFSGVETSTPTSDSQAYSVLVTRAMDEQMNVLRDPFNYKLSSPPDRQLYIVGGTTELTPSVYAALEEILAPTFAKIVISPDLKSVEINDEHPITCLCLTELDGVTLRDMGPEAFASLQRIVDTCKELLLVSLGSTAENFRGGMSKGMMRALFYEYTESRYQFFNIFDRKDLNAQTLAKVVLQLSQAQFRNDYKMAEYVWSTEPELRLADGSYQVQRTLFCDEQNKRFMANRRTIYETVDIQTTGVDLVESAGRYEFYLQDKTIAKKSSSTTIRVQHSTLNAIMVSNEQYLHIVLGTNVETNETVIALSNTCGSLVSVPAAWVVSSVPKKCNPTALIEALASTLMAESLLRKCKTNSSLLVHNADSVMRYVLSSSSREHGVRVHFISTQSDKRTNTALLIHEKMSSTGLKKVLPKNVSTIFEMSTTQSNIYNRVASVLPSGVARESLDSLTRCSPDTFDAQSVSKVASSLSTAAKLASHLTIPRAASNVVTAHSLSGKATTRDAIQTVDWSETTSVQTKYRTASSLINFSAEKTYLLIGLTGDLGRSMCKWMVTRGARHIVLTSRNPKIVPQWWLDQMSAMGANIVLMAMDVTSKESILDVDCAIKRDLPPLGGVFNGALVIADSLFARLTYDGLLGGMRPKVDGSTFLEELYGEYDLEFFIMFGSATAMAGNQGQTPYCAANTYMHDLVQNRRARGLVASILDAGVIVGVGVVQEIGDALGDRYVNTTGVTPLSEKDIHECFAECIIAGKPDSKLSPQIIAGPQVRDPEVWSDIIWYNNPRMWHYIDYRMSGGGAGSASAVVPMKEQLLEATSIEAAEEIVVGGFTDRIRKKLRMSPDEAISPATSPIEFGIDSLVAVDFRTWFSKELTIDVPILKLLSGSSIAEIATHVVSELPAAMIPNIAEGQTSSDTPSTDEKAASTTSEEASPVIVVEPPEETGTRTPSTDADDDSETYEHASEYHSHLATGITTGVTTPALTPNNKVTEDPFNQTTSTSKLAIERAERMSFAQSRYWFLNHYIKDRTTHNVTIWMSIEGGAFDPRQAEEAVRVIANRHDTFKTAFLPGTDEINEPVQAIMTQSKLRLEVVRVDSEEEVSQKYVDVQNHLYDIGSGDVAKVLLVIAPSGHQSLIAGWHHISMDAASFGVFVAELQAAYWKQPFPPVALQYPAFAKAQRLAWDRGEMKQDLTYWKRQFRTLPEPINLLPMANTSSRPVPDGYDLVDIDHVVGAATMAKVQQACKKTGSTAFHFFLATLRVFLNRLSGSNDFCIGIADANRLDAASMGTIGFLLNLLPLRFQSSTHNVPFHEVMKDARTKSFDAMKHSRLPFDLLLDELAVPRSSAHSPLFQVLLDWQAASKLDESVGNIKFDAKDYAAGKTGYDLTLLVTQFVSGDVHITFRLQKALYDGQQAALVVKAFAALVESLASDFNQICDNASIFEQAEIDKAMELGKGPYLESAWPSTVSRRFEEVAASHADKPALKEPFQKSTTYQQLEQKVNALASEMQKLGVKSNSPVCLYQQPTADWVSSMLAIWKLNAVYVPLDLRNPTERLQKMVQACEPSLILYHDQTNDGKHGLGQPQDKFLNVSSIKATKTSAAIKNQSQPNSRAAILYTSGSSGEPKGIQLRHSGIINWVEGYCSRWGLGAETVLQQSAMTFNHSIDQMLVALMNGGSFVVVPKELRGDPVSLTKIVQEENITYTKATPAEYATWLNYGFESLRKATNWKFAFAGGEHLTVGLVSLFRSLSLSNLRLFNSYGPGEITVSSHKSEIDYKTDKKTPGHIYPVGESLPNYTTIIVDNDLKPVPQGVSGEILIAGAGPCIGYLNLDKLNEEKFIQNDFLDSEYAANGWTKVYRTFDRGHLLADGSLVIEGRLDGDNQTKLRGIRLELEDIENTIMSSANNALSRVVVDIRGQENQILVAHVVFASITNSEAQRQLLQDLKTKLPLPQYMVPSMFIPVDKLPLNNHGKTDRRAIAAWPLPTVNQATTASGDLSESETALLDVWQSVLGETFVGDSAFGVSTDFFLVGGNSVALVKLQSTLQTTFNVHITLREIFEASTLGAMAELVKNAMPASTIDWAAETSIDDLSPSVNRPATEIKNTGVTVVLTGATGTIGKQVLNELIANPRVARINAIAVRAKDGGRQLGVSSDKLAVYYGDLAKANFDLDASTFDTVADSADLVIHSGANRSFWDAYSVLRSSNVSGTKTAIQLASRRGVPIHFLSSSNAALNALQGSAPPVDGSDGYIASKWASEQLLKKAAARLHVPVVIHRFANHEITSGLTPELDQELRSLVDKMQTIPVEGGWDGSFSLMPVSELALAVTQGALSTVGAAKPTMISTAVHRAAVELSTADLARETKAALGADDRYAKYSTLPAVKWLGRAKREHGFGWLVTAQNAAVGGARVTQR